MNVNEIWSHLNHAADLCIKYFPRVSCSTIAEIKAGDQLFIWLRARQGQRLADMLQTNTNKRTESRALFSASYQPPLLQHNNNNASCCKIPYIFKRTHKCPGYEIYCLE